jgi:hypothetical protein
VPFAPWRGVGHPDTARRRNSERSQLQERKMSIDWASVQWGYVALLSAFTFIAALIANVVTFRHRLAGAILSALLFAVIFVFATYYPHGIALPTLKSGAAPGALPAPTSTPPQ